MFFPEKTSRSVTASLSDSQLVSHPNDVVLTFQVPSASKLSVKKGAEAAILS
jgi:hypothetical protein